MNNVTIHTSQDDKTIAQFMDRLKWGSYAANRDYGASHDLLEKNGLGDESMRERYELELKERANFDQRAEALKNRLNPTV